MSSEPDVETESQVMTPHTEPSLIARLIDSKSVVVCLGPGGVGKTTTAAALGIAGAKRGLRVAVLTVDPARRLAQAMGLQPESDGAGVGPTQEDEQGTSSGLGQNSGLGNDPQLIEGPWGGELWGVMLDPKATFDQLIAEHADSERQRDAILKNRLYQNLTTSLAGTNEYMAAERLRSLHLDDRFDLVVLDTPPAHHAIDLLDSPGRLSRFFDHKLYRTILAPRPGVLRAMTTAANLVVRAIGQVVGSTLMADAIDFFNQFAGMDRGFRDRAAEVDELLASSQTSYVLISSPRSEPLAAARWVAKQLRDRGREIDALVVNRVTPNFFTKADLDDRSGSDVASSDAANPKPVGPPAAAPGPLEQNLAELEELRRAEIGLIDRAVKDLGSVEYVLIREFHQAITDIEGLDALGAILLGD